MGDDEKAESTETGGVSADQMMTDAATSATSADAASGATSEDAATGATSAAATCATSADAVEDATSVDEATGAAIDETQTVSEKAVIGGSAQ